MKWLEVWRFLKIDLSLGTLKPIYKSKTWHSLSTILKKHRPSVNTQKQRTEHREVSILWIMSQQLQIGCEIDIKSCEDICIYEEE